MKKKSKLSSSMKRFIWGMLYLSVGLAVVAGCANSQATFQSGDDKVKITTTIGMIADVTKQVGGDHVEVVSLMKSGVDPHLYKATQGDISKLNKAELIFYNGLHLEGKMGEILEKMNKNKPTIAVSRNIEASKLLAVANSTDHDPHIWFDVRNWMSATEVIRDELVKIDAAHAEQYKANASAYLKQLQALHEEVKTNIASIPKASRVLVTAHDAFGYFGAAYDIQVMGLQGISTASEAGLKDVTDLRDYLVDNKIKAVFVESSIPKKTIQAVVDGAKEKGHEVKIGGELFSDAMGAEGTVEGTYIGMVKHNVDTIVKALK